MITATQRARRIINDTTHESRRLCPAWKPNKEGHGGRWTSKEAALEYIAHIHYLCALEDDTTPLEVEGEERREALWRFSNAAHNGDIVITASAAIALWELAKTARREEAHEKWEKAQVDYRRGR